MSCLVLLTPLTCNTFDKNFFFFLGLSRIMILEDEVSPMNKFEISTNFRKLRIVGAPPPCASMREFHTTIYPGPLDYTHPHFLILHYYPFRMYPFW